MRKTIQMLIALAVLLAVAELVVKTSLSGWNIDNMMLTAPATVPDLPVIALPVATVLGLAFVMQSRKG